MFAGSQTFGQMALLQAAPQKHTIAFTTGLNPEWRTRVQYFRNIDNRADGARPFITIGATVAPLILSMQAMEFEIMGGRRFDLNGPWQAVTSGGFRWGHLKNYAGTLNGISAALQGTLFQSTSAWKKGFQLALEFNPATHMKHSSAAKATYSDRYQGENGDFTGPTDGWYRTSGLRLKLGIAGAKQFRENLSWQFAAGTQFNYQKQNVYFAFPYAQVPIYIENSLMYSIRKNDE